MKRIRRTLTIFLAAVMLMTCADFAALAETILTLPDELKIIEDEAFYGDQSIDRVVLPDGAEGIGSKAFANSSLTEINLPNSLQSIADDAFDGSDLTAVTVNEGTYAYDWAKENGYIGDWPESEHPYANKADETWSYRHPTEVYALRIAFSESTEFEKGFDYLYITDADGNEKKYTGTELSGESIILIGDHFELRLTSDSSANRYGFTIASIAGMSEQEYMEYIFENPSEQIPDSYVDPCNNAFVGTINGEEVIGFLDHTSQFSYGDGSANDFDASFVVFDDYGNIKYSIGIRLKTNTKEEEYSGNNEKPNCDYVSAHLSYDAQNCRFNDYFRIVEEKTDYCVKFNRINKDHGIIIGDVDAYMHRSKYGSTYLTGYSTVHIEGHFEFQLKTIHPVMAEYREKHADYAAEHSAPYFQSLYDSNVYGGGGLVTDSDGHTNTHTCPFCDGDGRCNSCNGSGFRYVTEFAPTYGSGRSGMYLSKQHCYTCGGNGRCIFCKGTGVRN